MPSAISHNFESLQLSLQNTLGVVIPDEQRVNLIERIEPLLSAYNLDSMESLAEHIQSIQADEIKSGVLDVLSQSQSDWNLSPEIRSLLKNYIFEQLPDGARVWIVGCEQGQLAYLVAMELAKYEHEYDNNKHIQLIATDVSQHNINFAELASYTNQQLLGLGDNDKKLFVTSSDNGEKGQIKDKIRRLISFSQCDLTQDFQSLGDMDLIICPDVLVYFSNEIKTDILKRFSALLKPGGIFLTDNNQLIMAPSGTLERVEHPAGLFYRRIH